MLWILIALILVYVVVKHYFNVHEYVVYGMNKKEAWKQWNSFKQELDKVFDVNIIDVEANQYHVKFYYSLKKKK